MVGARGGHEESLTSLSLYIIFLFVTFWTVILIGVWSLCSVCIVELFLIRHCTPLANLPYSNGRGKGGVQNQRSPHWSAVCTWTTLCHTCWVTRYINHALCTVRTALISHVVLTVTRTTLSHIMSLKLIMNSKAGLGNQYVWIIEPLVERAFLKLGWMFLRLKTVIAFVCVINK